MNTYIKATQGTKNQCFYAFVGFKDSMLVLSSFQGLNRSVIKKINLADISGLTKDDYWGGQRISFYDQGTLYQFFECGPAVVDYLQENLFV